MRASVKWQGSGNKIKFITKYLAVEQWSHILSDIWLLKGSGFSAIFSLFQDVIAIQKQLRNERIAFSIPETTFSLVLLRFKACFTRKYKPKSKVIIPTIPDVHSAAASHNKLAAIPLLLPRQRPSGSKRPTLHFTPLHHC